MSAEEIRKYDPEETELKAIMGEQFRDKTQEAQEEPVSEEYNEDAKHRTSINLAECARSIGFGGLTGLLFYWEQIGLMAESIAVPSMIVCAALFGLGIGKVVGKR
jgi:hypothetical protein